MSAMSLVISLQLITASNEVCEGYVFTGVCLSMGGHEHGAWQGGDMHGWGACMAGGMHGRGHAWQGRCAWWGCVWWGPHTWQGACVAGDTCMVGGVHSGGGHAWQGGMHGGTPPTRYYEILSMSRLYASY